MSISEPNDISEVHDYCLDYEMEILSAVEALAERRIKATKNKSISDFKNIAPLLDVIIENAEIYPMHRKTPSFSYGDIRRIHRTYVSN